MPGKFYKRNSQGFQSHRNNTSSGNNHTGPNNNRPSGRFTSFGSTNPRNNSFQFRNATSNNTSFTRPATLTRPAWAEPDDKEPPVQPELAFSSQQLFNYSHYLIGKDDYSTLHKVIEEQVLIRRAIMSIWKPDNKPIDMELMSSVARCNMNNPIFRLPIHFDCRIRLPTSTNKFNNYVWALMYHAMLPGIMPIKFSALSLDTFVWIFHEFMATLKTASRSIVLEGLISEERNRLNKRIRDKRSPEYMSELRAIRLRHGDELRNKMKSLRIYYEEYTKKLSEQATDENVDTNSHPEMRVIWERITFNPVVCGIDEYVQPIINSTNYKILFLEFVDRYNLEDYQTLIRALRNKFYTEYPEYRNEDMFDVDETCAEIQKIYEAKANIVQAQLDRDEDARVAAAIAKRQAEDEEWYRNHPNWEEEEEEWNENFEGVTMSDARHDQPEEDYVDECERRTQYIPIETDMQLKTEAREEYCKLHEEEIIRRHNENEVKYNKWRIVTKYIETLIGLAQFKMQLAALNESNTPLDDSKVDYNTDHYDPTKRYDTFAEQMEKSRISLVLNFYAYYDSILAACAEPFRPFPKHKHFNDPIRTQYSNLKLEEMNGSSRIQLSFNAIEPSNIESFSFLFKSLYNIEDILPQCIVHAASVSGSDSIANSCALFIKSLTTNYDRITDLIMQQKIGDHTVIRNKNFWFFFWALWFENIIVIQTEPSAMLHTLLEQCVHANNQGACFVAFRLTLDQCRQNGTNVTGRYESIKDTLFKHGLTYLHTFKLDNYYAVIDTLEIIDQFQLTQYRKANGLK